jgi:hypothetical protein
MNLPRIFRGLRIAWTVMFGILCVLLIALWVRSYWICDGVIGHISDTRLVAFDSFSGALSLSTSVWPSLPPAFTDYEPWKLNSLHVDEEEETWFAREDVDERWAFYLAMPPNQESGILAPYWFLVLLAAALAAAPWVQRLNWRFSVRTLLIAITLVAVGLGTVIYLSG